MIVVDVKIPTPSTTRHTSPPPPPVYPPPAAMPFSLLSPPPPSPPPLVYPATSTFSANKLFVQRRSARTIVEASKNDDEEPAFNPFGFVTDNPSSRSAIQLPESPAEDGNVGQMLYVIILMSSVIFFFRWISLLSLIYAPTLPLKAFDSTLHFF